MTRRFRQIAALSWATVASSMGALAMAASDTPAAPAAFPADARFALLEREYVIDSLDRNPVVATYLGGAVLDASLAQIDSRLRDPSPEALAAEDRRLSRFRSQFLALDPRKLSPRRRIDREVAVAQIQFILHAHDVRHTPERALDSYVDEPFRGVDWLLQGFQAMGDGHYGGAADWAHLIDRVRAIPSYLERAQRQLAAGVKAGRTPDWRVLRGYGLESAAADRQYFAVELPRIAYERIGTANRNALLWDLTPAAARAADAYERLRAFILTTFYVDPGLPDETALKAAFRADRFALGSAEYNWALHNNLRITSDAAQLYAEAPEPIAHTRAEMVALSRQIAKAHGWPAPADDETVVRATLAALGRDAPRSDEEMIRWYRDTAQRLVDYGRRTGLFEVPDDYRLEVSETPPALRTSIVGAAYYPAPPFKASGVGRFFVTPTGDDPAALAANNRAALADLAAHEGFPGHDWHYKVMSRERERISLIRWLTPGAVEDSSSMWEDSMAAEGWALYAESLIGEPQPGFYTPEERLYQLQGLLLRDLRVRIDTGLHTQALGFEDAVDLLSQSLDFLPGSCRDAAATTDEAKRASCASARSEVFRYSRWPTQAITYRLGKDAIVALREAARQRLGPRYSARQFHLELMREGTIPAGYFHDELLDSLERDAAQGLPEADPLTTRKLSTK